MKIRNILVPIGGSPCSENALNYAIYLAKKFDARVLGIYVKDIRILEGPWHEVVFADPMLFSRKGRLKDPFGEWVKKIKKHFYEKCEAKDVKYTFDAEKGLVSKVILDKSRKADLVVMGKRGEHASWLKRHLGSACTRVLHNIKKPIMVVDKGEPQKAKKILLAYGGGFYSEKALFLTKEIMSTKGMDLSVLTIATKRTRAIKVQKEAKYYLRENKISAKYLLTIGDVGDEILKTIKGENIKMLITGASFHKGYEDLISTCLMNRILYDTNIPVLFVK